jgi:hypothetical protein
MTPEERKYKALCAELRRYPLNYDECWMPDQKEPLLNPIELRKAYEKFMNQNVNRANNAVDLFRFLLEQVKPETPNQ